MNVVPAAGAAGRGLRQPHEVGGQSERGMHAENKRGDRGKVYMRGWLGKGNSDSVLGGVSFAPRGTDCPQRDELREAPTMP